MVTIRAVLIIFYTRANYSCSSNKGYFWGLEEIIFLSKIKDISKGLEISWFGIVDYSLRSESGQTIPLWDQEYYVLWLEK